MALIVDALRLFYFGKLQLVEFNLVMVASIDHS